MDTVTVVFVATTDDFVRWNRRALRTHVVNMLIAGVFLLGALVLIAGGAVLAWLTTGFVWVLEAGIWLLVLSIAFVAFTYLYSPRAAASRAAARPGYFGEWTVELTADSVLWRYPAGEVRSDWALFDGVDRDAFDVYLHRVTGGWLAVPLRAFPDEAAAARFISQFHSRIGQRF